MSQSSSCPNPPRAGRSAAAFLFFSAVFAAALCGDLLVKWWAFNVWPGEPVDIPSVLDNSAHLSDQMMVLIPRGLAVKLTLNEGAVFGLWAGQRFLFVLATMVAIGVVGYCFATAPANDRLFQAALALVLAGALGNLYDRLVYTVVRDMLWLFPGLHLPFGLRWPGGSADVYPWIFNLADAYLLMGIVIILLRSMFVRDPAAKPQPQTTAKEASPQHRA